MTSIAYKQYCNISYNGGSYVCSPIKGPLSTSQTPSTTENKNRGITYAKNGQPSKDANCDNGNTNAIERKLYKNKLLSTEERYKKITSGNDSGIRDASFRTSLMKTTAIGKSGMNAENQALSFKSVHNQDIQRVKNRVRRTGMAVPRKVQAKQLPPPSIAVATYKSGSDISRREEKLSVFMPRHLKSRIKCNTLCDGGEIINNNDNCNTSKPHDHLISSTTLSDLPCLLTNNNIYIVDDIQLNTKQTVLNSSKIDDYSQYGVGRGRYLFSDVRLEDAFTILNHNKEQIIYIKGNKLNKFMKLVNGIEYAFYYGDVHLYVNGDFDVLSMYFYTHGYAGAKYLLRYIETCLDTTGLPCLTDPTSIRLTQLENNEYRVAFNDVTELYQSQYGLGKGIYLVKNVPIDLAFTISNKGLENKIYLSSNQLQLPLHVNGVLHLFFYGEVEIHVVDDFEYASLLIYNNNFIGGENIFKYTDACYDTSPLTAQGATDLQLTTSTNIPDTLYSQNLFKAYTYGYQGGAINVQPRSGLDTSMFIKYIVSANGPQLPSWLSINENTGQISGSSTNDEDAFYTIQFAIHAILNDNTYEEYYVNIALFNNNLITDELDDDVGGDGGFGGDEGYYGGEGFNGPTPWRIDYSLRPDY